MDRLRQMEVFAAVAEAGGFAAAARRLRMSPPAVTRAVAALEERLGARLLNRTTRSVGLTEAGERFLESTRRLLGEMEEAERAAVGEGAVPRGHLVVTASVTFGRMALAPVMTAFLSTHPRITASMVLVDRPVDLVDEGIDAAVRIGSLPDSSLVARRVGWVRQVTLASPDYVARRGAPTAPKDLALHGIIAFTGLSANRSWRFETDGRGHQAALTPRLEINDAAAAVAAAEAGEGVTTVYCYMAGGSVRAGRLVPVLADHWPPPVPVQLVYPHARLLAAKVRAFTEFTAPLLASVLPELSLPELSLPGTAAST